MTPPDPTPPEPALQAAARLLASGRPAEAVQRLGQMVAETPTYAAAHVLRATALEAAGRIDEAIVSWGRAAALVPRSPLVHRERERLLATRLAEAPPLDLPPAEPDPDHAPLDAPAPPEAASEDGPRPPADEAYGAPRTLDASDLVFVDAPLPPRRAAPPSVSDPVPPASPAAQDVEASPRDAAPPDDGPAVYDWAAVAPAQAPIVPPEGDLPPLPAPPPLPEPGGWGVLDEVDIPTPPPSAYAEPDVIAPESLRNRSAPTVADELDALITQLEDAPRIRPDPAYEGPETPLDAGDVDDLASETLAKIYAAQHQYVEAALIYEKLAARQPDQADELLERAAALRQRRP